MRVKRQYQGSVCVRVALNMLAHEPTMASLFGFSTWSKSSKAAWKVNLKGNSKPVSNSSMSENILYANND